MGEVRKYQCDECGACCSGKLILEINQLDVVREPKLLAHAKLMDGNGKITYSSEWEKEYLLACSNPCGLLVDGKRCGIYPTRPNACVAFEAGSGKCQNVRRDSGLPFLPDITGRVPTAAEVEALIEAEQSEGW